MFNYVYSLVLTHSGINNEYIPRAGALGYIQNYTRWRGYNSKNAKYAAIMRQKSRNMRRLCSKKLYKCDTHASKNSKYAGKSCKYAIKNVNYAVIT